MDILSERIKKRKNELKLTYDQIADQLFVTRVAVQNWGLGKALPNSDRIPDICRILQCTPNYLFGFSDVPSAQPDYTELKQEFLRMASYIDVLLECSDEQKETLMGFISRLAEHMPWTERD